MIEKTFQWITDAAKTIGWALAGLAAGGVAGAAAGNGILVAALAVVGFWVGCWWGWRTYFSGGGSASAGALAVASARSVSNQIKALAKLARPFNPESYFNPRKGLFIGLDSSRKPLYVNPAAINKAHVDVVGISGSGKSSIVGVLLAQLVGLFKEKAVVFDPKADKNLPGALARYLSKFGIPVWVIDLRMTAPPQINPLAGCRPDQVEELLQVALELGKTGQAAVDFHRGNDREGTELLAGHFQAGANTIPKLVLAGVADSVVSGLENLSRELRQLGRLPAFHTSGGRTLQDFLLADGPGLLYVIGSTTDLKVTAAQRLLLQRIMQILDERQNCDQPVALFMDELKYLLSPAALRAAGTIRDRNAHIIFAHQSMQDLEDCPGMDKNATIGAIWGNTAVKFVYRTEHPRTAQELESKSGMEVAQHETTSKTRAGWLAPEEGSWSKKEVARIQAGVIQNLPRPLHGEASVGIAFGLNNWPAFFLSTRYLESGPPPKPIPAPAEDEAMEQPLGADPFAEPATQEQQDIFG